MIRNVHVARSDGCQAKETNISMEKSPIAVRTIDHWIGQKAALARFRVALEASWNDGSRLPHILLVGPPGVGKTDLAILAGKEMGAGLVPRTGQVLRFPPVLNGLLLEMNAGEMLFIDEIHELSSYSQTTLYRAMDDHSVFVHSDCDKSLRLPINDFTIIAATTDEFLLLPPLRDRFKIILRLTHYESDEMSQIIQQRAMMMKVPLEDGVAEKIGARSLGTLRLGIRLLESCHRYARSQGENAISMRCFEEAVELEQIDALGLSQDEQRYLHLLSQNPTKPQRLNSIAASLGIHPRTVQTVIEPLLLRLGLIERDKGRILTEEGLEHVSRKEGVASA